MEPSPLKVSQNVKPLPMTSVLLTGATGYLGSHVLYELLATTTAHIYCLIRPSTQTTIEDKLREYAILFWQYHCSADERSYYCYPR